MCESCIHKIVCSIKRDIDTDTYARMGIKFNTKECVNYIPKENSNKAIDEYMQELKHTYNLIE